MTCTTESTSGAGHATRLWFRSWPKEASPAVGEQPLALGRVKTAHLEIGRRELDRSFLSILARLHVRVGEDGHGVAFLHDGLDPPEAPEQLTLGDREFHLRLHRDAALGGLAGASATI